MVNIKYRKPEEMKDSGVEWIGRKPREWHVKKLKYMSTIKNGATPTTSIPEYWDGTIPWFTPTDFSAETYLTKSARTITLKGLHSCATPLVPKDSVLITCRAPIGNLGIVGTKEAAFNQGCKSLEPHSVHHKYLCYSMIVANEFIRSRGKGTTFTELSSFDLKNVRILSPDASIQGKIVNFLDVKTAQFDSIISKKERLIEKLEEAKRSLISEVVTGKVKIVDGQMVERKPEEMKDSGIEWLGVVPRDWQIKRTKYLSKINQKTLSNNENAGMLINYIDIGSVDSTGEINQIQHFRFADAPSRARRIVTTDDIIVSTVRTYLKAIAFIEKQYNGYVCSTGFATLSSDKDKLNPKFLYYLLVSEKYINEIVARSVGVSYPAINASEIGDLFCVYPRIEEQNSIVSFLDTKIESVNGVINKLERLVSMLREAKQALISEAVTGKIDLRDWEIGSMLQFRT